MSKISQDIILNATIDKKVMNIDTTVEKDPVAMDAYIDKGSGGVKEVYHDETLNGKGTKDDPIGVNTEVIATKEDLESKQDKLTAGTNIKIEDNVISSTAQESFFRGTWKNWNDVSTNPEAYAIDYHGNKTPKENDYIVVQDTSDYRPGHNRPITVKVVNTAWGQTAWTLSIDGGESFTVPRSGSVIEKDYQGFKLIFAGTYEQVFVSATVDTVYESNLVVAGETIFIIPVRAETGTEYVSYWGGSDFEYQGSWRFSYHGVWEIDNKNGWVAEYQIEETLPIATETQAGINRTYTAGANISIEDNVISSTAQESFFRGRFAEWTSVPTSSADYTADFHGNTTPSYNDYIVVEDSSLYIPQDFLSDPNNVMIRNLHSSGVSYTIEVVIQDQIRRIYYTECTNGVYAQINDWLSVTYMGGTPGVWYIKTNKEFYINNVFTPTANKLLLLKTNTPYETNFYLSEEPGVAPLPIYGSWRFVYHGVWADDNILGWKPEYQVEETLPMATDTQAGIAKLYKTSGSNTDGAMTQYAVGAAINAHNTATNAHSNIRGVAGGLATLDNNAKVPMSQINDALLGNVSYQGVWDAATNVPYLQDPAGELPEGYTQYGYLETVSGTPYIDTGVAFDANTNEITTEKKVYVIAPWSAYDGVATTQQGNTWSGAVSGVYTNNTNVLAKAGGQTNTAGVPNEEITISETINRTDKFITWVCNGVSKTVAHLTNDTFSEQNIYLLALNRNGGVVGGSRNRIYYFNATKDGTLVARLIPAQRDSDGVYGMYDMVSGSFIPVQGNGTVTGGGQITTPKGHYYITSVAGDRFGLHFDVGDWVISTGEGWTKVDNTDAVVAVNGMTGNVVLNANDVNAYNKTEIDDKFAEVNAQINTNTEAIADAKDDINDLQTQINTRTRVIIRRWE